MKKYFWLWLCFFPLLGKGQVITFNKAFDYKGEAESGISVIVEDSNYLIIGIGQNPPLTGGWFGAIIIRTDLEGNVIHDNYYGKRWSNLYANTFGGLIKHSDGNYVIASSTSDTFPDAYNAAIIKFDSNGDTLFVREFGGAELDEGNQLIETNDKGFLMVGTTTTLGLHRINLIKLDSLGNFEWEKKYAGNSGETKGLSVADAFDGGFIISGFTTRFGYGTDTYVIKTDSTGNEQWRKTYGSKNDDYWGWLIPSSDSSYIVFGVIDTFNLGNQLSSYVMKIDLQGNIIWRQITNNPIFDFIYKVTEVGSGKGYIAAGEIADTNFQGNNSVGWFIRFDNDGNILWERRYAFPDYTRQDSIASYSNPYDVQNAKDGGFICTGITFYGNPNFWLLKLDSLGCMDGYCGLTDTNCYYLSYPNCDDTLSVINTKHKTQNSISVFPNPATQTVMIQTENVQSSIKGIMMFDVMGKVVSTTNTPQPPSRGDSSALIDVSTLPNGLYLLHIEMSNGQRVVRKVVKE